METDVKNRERMIDVCCSQEVIWRGQGARIQRMKGRRYKLWWFRKGDGVGGTCAMEKQEL